MQEQQSTWERLAPLSGLIFVAIIIGVFAIGGSTPDGDASAQKATTFYVKHHDKQAVLAFILATALPFIVFFASGLRNDLRRAGGTGQLANAAFGGGVLVAVGVGILATVHLALASAGAHARTIGAIPALNVLDGNDFLPAIAGLLTLMFASGLAVVRHGALPKWLGWAAIVLAIVMLTPAAFPAMLLSLLWIAIASIMLTVARGRMPSAIPAA
jgi:hypothetical protein